MHSRRKYYDRLLGLLKVVMGPSTRVNHVTIIISNTYRSKLSALVYSSVLFTWPAPPYHSTNIMNPDVNAIARLNNTITNATPAPLPPDPTLPEP